MLNSTADTDSLVSLLTTVYNGENHIEAVLRSLLSQSYTNLEIIVVDDGSSDGSVEILRRLRSQDSRIRFFEPGRLGRARALNFGIEQCHGKYIAINDADDLSQPERIAREVSFLEKNSDHGMVGTQYLISNLLTGQIDRPILPTSNAEIREALTRGQCFHHSSVMFRANILRAIGGYSNHRKFLLDRDVFIRAGAVSKLANLPETLVTVQHHGGRYFYFGFSRYRREIQHNWMRLVAVYKLGFPKSRLLKPLGALFLALIPSSFRFLLPKVVRTKLRQLLYPDSVAVVSAGASHTPKEGERKNAVG